MMTADSLPLTAYGPDEDVRHEPLRTYPGPRRRTFRLTAYRLQPRIVEATRRTDCLTP